PTTTPTTQIYPLSLHDALPISHEDQGFDRVRLLGSPEARHAVRDRLASRQPNRAGRECSKDEQKRQRSGSFLRERIRRRHGRRRDRKSTRLNSSHVSISYAVFC